MSTAPCALLPRSSVSDLDVVEAAADLVRVPSPSGSERAAAELFAARAGEWGLEAVIDGAGNAHAWSGPDDGLPTVLMVGHLDTVPGGPAFSLEGDVLRGRGSVDAKGPLVSMLAAAARYAAAGPARLRVGVVGAVEEETPCSRGAVFLREHLPAPQALVVGEPSGWEAVTVGYKGKLDLEYLVTTEARHPAHPGAQASEVMVTTCARLLERYGTAGNARFDDVSLAVTDLQADCGRARCELSFRTPPGHDLPALQRWVEEQCPDGTVRLLNGVGAVRVRRSDPVVGALSAAIARVGGRPRHQVKTGTSDMNTLAEAWSVPMATYGPGDASLDHSDDEHVLVGDLVRGTQVLESALDVLATRLTGAGATR